MKTDCNSYWYEWFHMINPVFKLIKINDLILVLPMEKVNLTIKYNEIQNNFFSKIVSICW